MFLWWRMFLSANRYTLRRNMRYTASPVSDHAGCESLRRSSEPMLNVPTVVTATLGAFVLVHGLRVWFLSPRAYIELLKQFSFVPARYEAAAACGVPDTLGPKVWTF